MSIFGTKKSSSPGMYYFLYGTLQYPDRLRRVLGIPDDQPLPDSRPARVRRYRTCLWGEYPALVRSDQFQQVSQRSADEDEPAPEPAKGLPDTPTEEAWDRSLEFDVVPGHVIKLDPDKHEKKMQEYETENYMPQFVEVEVLQPQKRPPLSCGRKRKSAVRFDVPMQTGETGEDDDADEGEPQQDEGRTADKDDDRAGEEQAWESSYAKTFVWVGNLDHLREGRWSLGQWVDRQVRARRGGLQFNQA